MRKKNQHKLRHSIWAGSRAATWGFLFFLKILKINRPTFVKDGLYIDNRIYYANTWIIHAY